MPVRNGARKEILIRSYKMPSSSTHLFQVGVGIGIRIEFRRFFQSRYRSLRRFAQRLETCDLKAATESGGNKLVL